MPSARTLDVALRAYRPAHELLGAEVPERITLTNINAVREAAGLMWEPAAEPQYRVRKLGPGAESVEEVPGLKYVTRGEGGPVLGSLGTGYHLFGNAELFGIAETIGTAALEAGRQVRFLSAGEVHGGRRVYLLADLGEPRELPGDPSPYVRYMTLLSSHDGRGAVKVLGTANRWFCTNALRATEVQAAASAAAFSFRHTSKLAKRLEDSRKAMVAALTQHDAVEQRVREMLATPVTQPQVSEYLAQFALAMVVSKQTPHRAAQAAVSKARENALERLEGELRRIYDSPTCEGIRDSAYGPFAAVGEYLDNVRPAESPDSLFMRTMALTERHKVTAYAMARKAF